MEENTKKKIEFTVAGITMSLVTDESDAFVGAVVKSIDEKMSALLRNMKRSQLDAAMLCAMDFCADKIKAENHVRNLEAQVSLYEVNMRRLKEDVASLKALLGESDENKAPAARPLSEQITMDEDSSADAAEEEAAEEGRENKLKMIESLLRREK